MPPKAVPKSVLKEKEKIAVDKTFGLKNKNKSKAVQKYIKTITSNAKGNPVRGGQEAADRVEKEKKQENLQKAALMNSLFNMQTDRRGRAYDPVAKKQAKQLEEEALAAGKKLNDEIKKAIIEGVANTIRMTNPKGIRMSELGGHPIIHALKDKHADTFKTLSLLLFLKANEKVFWLDDAESSNPTIRCTEDVEAEVAPDERPIEEIIEERRAALPPGGTPVTLETFKAWKEKREAERLARVESDRKDAAKKGKAHGGLSGRDLFTYDASLFVDDDDAVSEADYEERVEGPLEDSEDEGDANDEDEAEVENEEEGEDEGDGEGDGDGGARGSTDGAAASSSAREAGEGSGGVAINAALFLQEDNEDLPDDLDELEDEDEEEGEKKG